MANIHKLLAPSLKAVYKDESEKTVLNPDAFFDDPPDWEKRAREKSLVKLGTAASEIEEAVETYRRMAKGAQRQREQFVAEAFDRSFAPSPVTTFVATTASLSSPLNVAPRPEDFVIKIYPPKEKKPPELPPERDDVEIRLGEPFM